MTSLYWKKFSVRLPDLQPPTTAPCAVLHQLGWRNLADRHRDLHLTLLFKIIHGHVDNTAEPWALLNLTPETVLSTDTNSSSHVPPPKNCSIPTGQYWTGTRSLHLWPSQTWPPSNRPWPGWSAPATSTAAHPWFVRYSARRFSMNYLSRPDLHTVNNRSLCSSTSLVTWSCASASSYTQYSQYVCSTPPAHSGGHGSSGTRPKHEVTQLARVSQLV